MRKAMVLALSLGIAAPAYAQEAPDRHFTVDDLFGLTVAADPQISPDGRQIAYVRRANDIMTDAAVSSIWMVDTAKDALALDQHRAVRLHPHADIGLLALPLVQIAAQRFDRGAVGDRQQFKLTGKDGAPAIAEAEKGRIILRDLFRSWRDQVRESVLGCVKQERIKSTNPLNLGRAIHGGPCTGSIIAV